MTLRNAWKRVEKTSKKSRNRVKNNHSSTFCYLFRLFLSINFWKVSCREGKSAHDHHRQKIFWGTFLASKRNFPGWWWIYKNLMKTRKAISTTEIFPLWPPFFRQRTVLHWSRAVYVFFFPELGCNQKSLCLEKSMIRIPFVLK